MKPLSELLNQKLLVAYEVRLIIIYLFNALHQVPKESSINSVIYIFVNILDLSSVDVLWSSSAYCTGPMQVGFRPTSLDDFCNIIVTWKSGSEVDTLDFNSWGILFPISL